METIRAGLPNGTPLELWWQDEARVGQKNKIARRWARRGTRPRAPHDQRTSSVSIFGAICPQQGKGAALVMPKCDTQAMTPFGPNLRAFVIYLRSVQGLPLARLCTVLADLFGLAQRGRAAVHGSQFDHPLRVDPVAPRVADKRDAGLRQGPCLIGAQHIHGAEIVDGGQALDDAATQATKQRWNASASTTAKMSPR